MRESLSLDAPQINLAKKVRNCSERSSMARSSGRQRANLVATFIGKKTDSLTMLAARRRAAWNILPNFLFERSDNKARQNANAISMLRLRYEPTGHHEPVIARTLAARLP
jgi:hypothetical protein